MNPMQSIPRPEGSPILEDAIGAIRPSFNDLIELSDVSVEGAAGRDMSDALTALAQRAQSVGWPLEMAQEAITTLVHERP